MIAPQPIGFLNTGLPLVGLVALAVVLPLPLVPGHTRSQRRVAAAIAASAGLLLLAGALVFAALYRGAGVAVGGALAEAPLATVGFFLGLSARAALIWGPVLALVWLGLAQRVERRRGEDMARRDRQAMAGGRP